MSLLDREYQARVAQGQELAMKRWLRCGLLLGCCLAHAAARAELWGYVDGAGVAHFAGRALNSNYALVMGEAAPRSGRVPGKTDGSRGMLTWLEIAPEVKSVQPWLREAAAQHGVDVELLKAVIAVESGFDAKVPCRRAARSA
jgi:hypothetical protein